MYSQTFFRTNGLFRSILPRSGGCINECLALFSMQSPLVLLRPKCSGRSLSARLALSLVLWAAAIANGAIPGVPSGTTPGTTGSPGPTQASSTVSLSWSTVSGATYYDIGVRDVVTNALVLSTTTTNGSYTVALTANSQYRWNVAACNTSGALPRGSVPPNSCWKTSSDVIGAPSRTRVPSLLPSRD